jgi:hypothetical protein
MQLTQGYGPTVDTPFHGGTLGLGGECGWPRSLRVLGQPSPLASDQKGCCALVVFAPPMQRCNRPRLCGSALPLFPLGRPTLGGVLVAGLALSAEGEAGPHPSLPFPLVPELIPG